MTKIKPKPLYRQNNKKSLFNREGSTIIQLGAGGLTLLMNQDVVDWLHLRVGQRGKMWDFGSTNTANMSTLSVAFNNPEHGTLFILTWLGKQ